LGFGQLRRGLLNEVQTVANIGDERLDLGRTLPPIQRPYGHPFQGLSSVTGQKLQPVELLGLA
jgi:hypothetical protein